MKTTLQMIWILVVIFIIKKVRCQDGFSEDDFLRLQRYSMNDGQKESVTNYNTNNMQRHPQGQSMSSVSIQYNFNDDNNSEYSRTDHGKSRDRKVYRIKNPLQDVEEDKTLQNSNTQDSAIGASNQYAAMLYSLPPEDFLQKMRAESQYHQQQQLTTQVSASPYTATQSPQPQYSTIQPSTYDISQQSNQMSTLEPKSYTPVYQSNSNLFQYSNPSIYNLDNSHSTPSPPYMSTPLPNSQYLSTPANTFVSSSSPIYLSTLQNLQQYVSSPSTNTQSGILDYINNRVTTIGSNYDSSNELSKRMQIDHYDNSANGIRYPSLHVQNQYQNDFALSTASPTSSAYPDSLRDPWQSSLNIGYKSENGYSQNQFQNLKYTNNQQDIRQGTNADTSNSYHINSIPSANNLFLNYVQPDYQIYSNTKSQARDSEQEASQPKMYSHGDYGWKLSDKKSSFEPELSTKNNNYFKYQINSLQPESGAVSQVSFQMDSSQPYNYEQNTKPVTEKLEAEEFARAATKAQEKYRQQLEVNKYLSSSQYNNNNGLNNFGANSYYNNENLKQANKQYNGNIYGNSQSNAVTTSPFYYVRSLDTFDSTTKQPFDHDKALKNIVPIDVTNVVQNSESSGKVTSDTNINNRYNFLGHNKDTSEQSLKEYLRQVDSYYGDKNTLYSIKQKPDDYISIDKFKQLENVPYYGKHQIAEAFYNLGSGNKRFGDEVAQSLNFAKHVSNSQQDNSQSSANIHQHGAQHPQISTDIANLLKFSDIPYRLTQSINYNSQNLRNNNFDHGNIPSPIPVRINQNVDNHQTDVAAEILNKLMLNKQNNYNKPDIDSQSDNTLSTINGFKVVNPFNVDLKLVADMLKGKLAIDESQVTSLRESNKPLYTKFDIAQLQQLLQLKNHNNAMVFNDGLTTIDNSFLDSYNSGRFPYQGVKYSRSEEEPENIPIADSSNNHPIGAVIDQDDVVNGEGVLDVPESGEDIVAPNFDSDRSKNALKSGHRGSGDTYKYPGTHSSRYSYKRKYPKSEFEEPYPLLKPPPPQSSRHRSIQKGEKGTRRRRVTKPKMLRVYNAEPLFEAGSSIVEDNKPTHLKRSHSAEERSDTVNEEEAT